MSIDERVIDQAFSDCRATHGGCKEDYFGLLYLEKEFDLSRDQAAVQVAFGGNDYGIDGFHIDPQRRNLYLFQFKWSQSHGLFKESLQRLIDAGMERVFGSDGQAQEQNQMLLQLKSRLISDQALVDRVIIQFVFNGDPAEAERSQVLDKLREDLESKKYLIDQHFKGRAVGMSFEFRSAKTKRVAGVVHQRKTHEYPLQVENAIERPGPNGEVMYVGFVPLADLYAMYREMNYRLFERNIRAGLDADKAPNRAIANALKQIVLQGAEPAAVFAFNHNGVTLFAERVDVDAAKQDRFRVTEPRVLNGAQTITTLHRFLEGNKGHPRLKNGDNGLDDVRVLCKIITKAKPEFVVSVTINNNRQNPVEPWDLRANDRIQLDIHDKLNDEVHIYYERQKNAFDNLTGEDLEALEITEYKAIELLRLAKTFLASDGEIDRMRRMRDVFENEKMYSQVFNEGRLQADSREIVLCYKVQLRLNRLIREIQERGSNKYAYMQKARNLLWALICQGILNDERLPDYKDRFVQPGRSLVCEADYTEWLRRLASTRVRPLLAGIVEKPPYAQMMEEERYDFLRTRAVYDKCMELAYKKWKWVQKRLK